METNKELLQQAIEQVDGCMCPTQIEPEDAAAWQVVRAALAKKADAAPVVPSDYKLLTLHEKQEIQRRLIHAGTYDYVNYGAEIERITLVRSAALAASAKDKL